MFDDVLDSFITRAQKLAQRLLKRNLGDRTWNAVEISSELRRLNDDVQSYLSVHTVSISFFFFFFRHNVLCTIIFDLKVQLLDLIHS